MRSVFSLLVLGLQEGDHLVLAGDRDRDGAAGAVDEPGARDEEIARRLLMNAPESTRAAVAAAVLVGPGRVESPVAMNFAQFTELVVV
ncbi:hypothetical protein [Nonomuraea salmonea]|uniref:hypothetical protein n=1 Tax=Nonomuraea salmonea TaxID=46181 RepID=UPI0031EC3E3E